MFEKKEAIPIILAIILMTIIVSFSSSAKEIIPEKILSGLIISLIIIFVALSAKKITARVIDVKVTLKTWQWQRYWLGKGSYFKKPIPVGLFLPLLILFLSVGFVKFLAFLQFEIESTAARVAKKFGKYRFKDLNEWDDALIGFYSLLAVLLLSLVASFFISINAFPFRELSKYALYYAISNLLPIGMLDGTKIFFGSRPLYIFSWIITIIFGLVIILILL